MTEKVEILTFASGPLATNAYLIVCLETKKVAIVDPAPQVAERLIQVIEQRGFTPTCIILTHTHWDHIADVDPLADHFALPVFVHEEDAYNLISPGSDRIPSWLEIKPRVPDRLLKEGDSIPIGNTMWQVIHTPGHSPGCICLYNAEEKLLLSGDTLFKSSIGNLSFGTSDPARMWPSLKKLAQLPPETKVFPGHGDSTTIGKESWLDHAEDVFG